MARYTQESRERVLRGLFEYYCSHLEELPPGASDASRQGSPEGAGGLVADRVIDYLAGMTDRFAIRAWTDRFVPQGLAL